MRKSGYRKYFAEDKPDRFQKETEMSMNVVFMGTPDFAVPTLAALHDAGHTIVAVYTQPPRPAGRGKQLQPSPVQKEAEIRQLEVRSPVLGSVV